MGRRRVFKAANERSALGDHHVDSAVVELSRAAQKTAALMTSYEHSRETTLPMLFRDDDLDKLKQVRGMVDTRTDYKHYPIAGHCNLTVNYEGALVPAIEVSRLHIQPDRVGALLRYIEAVRAIHLQFEEVKQVLRWLNRNATPGAIRYYWPSAMQLCPNAPCWAALQDVPTRFNEPVRIGPRMQMLRDAATTVTNMLMLPNDAKANNQNKMWLTFASYRQGQGEVTWMTDQMTYHI